MSFAGYTLLILIYEKRSYHKHLADRPVDILDYVKHIPIEGHILCPPIWGGEIAYHVYPKRLVSCDVRWDLYTKEEIFMCETIYNEQASLNTLLDQGDYAIVLVPTKESYPVLLDNHENWYKTRETGNTTVYLNKKKGEAFQNNSLMETYDSKTYLNLISNPKLLNNYYLLFNERQKFLLTQVNNAFETNFNAINHNHLLYLVSELINEGFLAIAEFTLQQYLNKCDLIHNDEINDEQNQQSLKNLKALYGSMPAIQGKFNQSIRFFLSALIQNVDDKRYYESLMDVYYRKEDFLNYSNNLRHVLNLQSSQDGLKAK